MNRRAGIDSGLTVDQDGSDDDAVEVADLDREGGVIRNDLPARGLLLRANIAHHEKLAAIAAGHAGY